MEAKRRHNDLLPWSYRLTPDALTRLGELLKQSFPMVLWGCHLADGSRLTSSELSDILSLSNRDDERVKNIGVTASTDAFSERVSLDFVAGGNIQLSINHDPSSSKHLQKDIKDLCFNLKPRYSAISDLGGLPKFVIWVLFEVLGGALNIVWGTNTNLFGVSPTLKFLAWGLLLQNIPALYIFFGDKVFPRASYVFGAGQRRDELAGWWRNAVLWSFFLLIAGAIVSLVF